MIDIRQIIDHWDDLDDDVHDNVVEVDDVDFYDPDQNVEDLEISEDDLDISDEEQQN